MCVLMICFLLLMLNLRSILIYSVCCASNRYIVTTESGNVLIWNVRAEAVLFKAEHKNVQQLLLLDDDTKCVTVSKVSCGRV